MGLFGIEFKKNNKNNINQSLDNDANYINNDEIEKSSYSAYSYKNVKKLREKGKYKGIDVPFLQYPVKKQEKPRPLFIVFGIVDLILLALSIVFAVIITKNFLLPLFGELLNISWLKDLNEWDIFGLASMFGSLFIFLLWIIAIFVASLLIAMIVYFILQARKMFCLSKASMQEMAVGYEISRVIFNLIIAIVLFVAIAVVIVVQNKNINSLWFKIIISVIIAVVLTLTTLVVLLIVQRNKAKKEFNQLPEEQKQDFIKHNRALFKVRTLKNATKGVFGSRSVDF